jgi:hypothetical protein
LRSSPGFGGDIKLAICDDPFNRLTILVRLEGIAKSVHGYLYMLHKPVSSNPAVAVLHIMRLSQLTTQIP